MTFDPRLLRLRDALAARPVRRLPREPGQREAAVAIVLRPRARLELLLIQRAVYPGDPWSGHMALPGGRREPTDADLLAIALRELGEETELRLPRERCLGALDEVAPGSVRLPALVVAPFVLAAESDAVAHPDAREVAAALWVPLAALAAQEAVGELVLELEGDRRVFPTYRYEGYEVWGLTHRILMQFLQVADGAGIMRD